jgi:serine/threonine protein kinase
MSRIVGNYEIRSVLGEGGMGTVYYGVHLALQRETALKCLRPELAQRREIVDRFRSEAQTQARLNSPYIAQLYEYFQHGAEHFMAIEFVNGKTLSRVLEERGRLTAQEACTYVIQALRGLDHAHKNRIIHRDIKPANLMLNQDGQIKVTDFGIARVLGSDRATRMGNIVGTFEYISPETVEGREATALSDLYSSGVVLFELIVGRLPFQSQSEYELVRMHVQAPRPAPGSFVPNIPAELDRIVQQAMARDPSRRFRSAAEMADALQRCTDEQRARTGEKERSGWWRWGRRPEAPSTSVEGTFQAPAGTAVDRRRTDISSTTHRVEDLLSQHMWDDAGTIVENCLRSYPGEPELLDLRARIQRQRQAYEQAIQQHTQLARELMARDLPDAAASALDTALAMYPRESTLLELKREAQRRLQARQQHTGEITELEKRVEGLMAAGKFQQAADSVLELQDRLPNHPSWERCSRGPCRGGESTRSSRPSRRFSTGRDPKRRRSNGKRRFRLPKQG